MNRALFVMVQGQRMNRTLIAMVQGAKNDQNFS